MNGEVGWWERSTGRDGIPEIESRLSDAFKPVEPRAEYVRELKRRLLSNSEPIELATRRGIFAPIFVLTASLVSGTLLVVLGIKGLRHLRVQPALEEGIVNNN